MKSSASTSSETDKAGDITLVKQQMSKLETVYRQNRHRLEQQKSVLVSKDLFQLSSVNKFHVPCQYCGSANDQPITCPQAEVCPTCNTKDHSLKYIFPMLKEVQIQERSNKSYRDDDHPEQVNQVNEGTSSIQVTPVANLPTPIVSQTGQIGWNNMHLDTESSWGRNMHRTQ